MADDKDDSAISYVKAAFHWQYNWISLAGAAAIAFSATGIRAVAFDVSSVIVGLGGLLGIRLGPAPVTSVATGVSAETACAREGDRPRSLIDAECQDVAGSVVIRRI